MKRLILTCLVGLVVSWAVPVGAISARSSGKKDEKAQKTTVKPAAKPPPAAATTNKRPRMTTRRSSQKTLLENLRRRVKESKGDKRGQFDNYIDRNKDGVDDRVRRPSTRRVPRKTTVAAPRQKNTPVAPKSVPRDTSRPRSAKKKPG